MGSSLGPVLANIILSEFENIIVPELVNSGVIKFYRKYVDDTLLLIRPIDIQFVLDKFNSFEKNLKFTFDDFPDGYVYFLDLKITKDSIDIFRKNTHTGQYTNFSSFEPFSREVSWINSLFFRASKICSNATLFNNQINKIKRFMSWNGFPTKVRNFLIKKLKAKLCNDSNITLHGNNDNDDSESKIWLKLPYLGRQGEFLVKNLIRGVRRSLKIHVKIIVVYQTKKTPFLYLTKIKFWILIRPMLFMNFRALDAVILI